jgi:hypothetical protein
VQTFTLTVGGKEYQAAPLPLGAVRKFTRDGTFAKLDKASSGNMADVIEAFDAIIQIIAAALRPHHPECDEAWVADNVPCGQQGSALLTAVLRASGMIGDGEGDGGGNATSP